MVTFPVSVTLQWCVRRTNDLIYGSEIERALCKHHFNYIYVNETVPDHIFCLYVQRCCLILAQHHFLIKSCLQFNSDDDVGCMIPAIKYLRSDTLAFHFC